MHLVVGRHADQVVVERAVVDRAETQAVAHLGLAVHLEIADDVRRVEQAALLQPTDRAALAVGRHDPAAEPSLVDAHARLPEHVPPLDRVVHDDRLPFVQRPDHLSG